MPDTSKATASPPRLANRWAQEQSLEAALQRVQLRRRRGARGRLKERSRSEGGLELLQQLSPPGPGPVALGEEPLHLSPPTPAPRVRPPPLSLARV